VSARVVCGSSSEPRKKIQIIIPVAISAANTSVAMKNLFDFWAVAAITIFHPL